MIKPVQPSRRRYPFTWPGQLTVWAMATVVNGGAWVPPGMAQESPGVTFAMPTVCTADLEQALPDPGTPTAEIPLAVVGPPPNPVTVPTQPGQVAIAVEQLLSLDQAVALAYRNNPSLETARLSVEQSRATVAEARASLAPRVDLTSRLDIVTNPALGQDLGDEGSVSTVGALTGNVSATYDVLTGGERAARIEVAELQLQQQQLALEQAQEALKSQISLAYYDVQSARERIRISQAFLTETCRNLRDTILFYDAGVGTRFDVLRAEVEVGQARQDIVLARSTWATAQRRLAAQLNLPGDFSVSTTPVSPRGVWPLTLEESIVLAFQNRAELEIDLVQRDVATAQRQIALSALRPRAQALGSVNAAVALSDVSSANIPGFDSNTSAGFGLRLGGSWRVFDGGAARATAHQAEQDLAIADATFSLDRNQIRLSVEDAYYNLEANQANIDTARAAVKQAREALRLSRRRFDAGVGDQLDVLAAQRELTEAEVQLLDAILGYNRSLVSLERAVSNLTDSDLAE